MFKKA